MSGRVHLLGGSRMKRLAAILTALAAVIGSVSALIVSITGGEAAPQPITHIIIQEIGDYQDFVEQTELPQFEHLKGSS